MPYEITKRTHAGVESPVHFYAAPGRELDAAAGMIAAVSCGDRRHAAAAMRQRLSYTASSRAGDFYRLEWRPAAPR